jgi:hypothetical protein
VECWLLLRRRVRREGRRGRRGGWQGEVCVGWAAVHVVVWTEAQRLRGKWGWLTRMGGAGMWLRSESVVLAMLRKSALALAGVWTLLGVLAPTQIMLLLVAKDIMLTRIKAGVLRPVWKDVDTGPDAAAMRLVRTDMLRLALAGGQDEDPLALADVARRRKPAMGSCGTTGSIRKDCSS